MAKDIKLGIVINQSGNAAKNIGGISSILGKLGGIAGGVLTGGLVLAGAGVVALGKGLFDSVGAAMEAQEGQAQLAAVLKSTAGVSGMTVDSINDLASSLQKVTPFTDDAILAGQNLLLTFTNIGKDVFPMATETMLDMAAALGTDAPGAAIQLGKALNDPIAGIGALSRVGVTFTDGQKDMIKSLVESGDVIGAQKIILAELSKEFGGSAKAAGETFPGKLEILKNTFGDIQEAIGGAFLPILSEVTDMFTAGLNSDFVQGALKRLTNFIAMTVVPWLEIVSQVVKDFTGTFGELGRIFFGVGSDIYDTNDAIRDFLFSLGLSSDVVNTVEGVLISLESITAGLGSTFGELGRIFFGVGGDIYDTNDSIREFLFSLGLSSGVVNTVEGVLITLESTIARVSEAFTEGGIQGVFLELSTIIQEAWPAVQATLIEMGNRFWDWLTLTALPLASAKVNEWATAIATAVTAAWPSVWETLSTWGVFIWDWLVSAVVLTNEKMAGFVKSISDWVLGHSGEISTFGETVGGYIYDGLSALFSDSAKSDGAITTLATSLGQSVLTLAATAHSVGATFAEGVVKGVIDKWAGPDTKNQWVAALRGALGGLILAFNPFSMFVPTGDSISGGIASGVKKGQPKIESAARSAARKAFDAAMSWLQAGSPSKLFSDQVGEMAIGGGIAEGIGRAAGAIKGATQGALGAAAGATTGRPALASPAAPGALAGAGTGLVINFTYSPVISLADRFEAQNVLAPFIAEGVRAALAKQGSRK